MLNRSGGNDSRLPLTKPYKSKLDVLRTLIPFINYKKDSPHLYGPSHNKLWSQSKKRGVVSL